MSASTLPRARIPSFVWLLLLPVLLWAGQWFTQAQLNEYVQQVIIYAGVNIILAVSLNLINGITGQFSLGHAGFMAVGAYAAACFTFYAGPRLALPGWTIFGLALLLAVLVSGIAGWLVGLPSLRLRGDYLAIVTLGFGQIIVVLIRNIEAVGGALGFNDIPLYTNFAWVYAMVFACILCVRNLADSQLGRSMRAVREDEIAAEAAGINTTRVKVLAFVISSMWAGIAGALQVHLLGYAHPDSFTFIKSVEVVVMVVLGGLGSITGVTIAAVLLEMLEEVLRSTSGAFYVVLGLIAFAAMLSRPRYLDAIKRGAIGYLLWLRWPLACVLALVPLRMYGFDWMHANVAAFRWVIYALILIVLMLLRPQGLLGRAEFSWNALRRKPNGDSPNSNPPGEQMAPTDASVRGTI